MSTKVGFDMKVGVEWDFGSVVIEGDRVTLVPIAYQYAEVIFAEFTDEITRYMMPATPTTIGEIEAFIRTSMEDMAGKTDLTMAILKKDDGEFLGVCGLHGKSNLRQPILGIWLKKLAHGYHYGQEAMRCLAAWARDHVEMDHMIYPCDKDNIPSRKVAEHLGGHIIRRGRIRNMSGRVLNEVVYKIE